MAEDEKIMCKECGKIKHLPVWEVCYKCNLKRKADGLGEAEPVKETTSQAEVIRPVKLNTSGIPIETKKMFWLNALNNSVAIKCSNNDGTSIERLATDIYEMSINWWNSQN